MILFLLLSMLIVKKEATREQTQKRGSAIFCISASIFISLYFSQLMKNKHIKMTKLNMSQTERSINIELN